MGNHESSRSLYAIPGLDYVAHEDVLPYTTNEKTALQHELFDKFLTYHPNRDPCFMAQETLKAWQKKNHPWLELSDVHKETTENVRVTVIPFYMGCRGSQTTAVHWVCVATYVRNKCTVYFQVNNLVLIKCMLYSGATASV